MLDLLHGITWTAAPNATPGQRATVLATATQDAVARFVLDDEKAGQYLEQQAEYAKWFRLVSPNQPSVDQRFDHDFFATVGKVLRAALADDDDGYGGGPSGEARRAVEQFFSEGLAGGEIVDVFQIAGEDRPEISVLLDEFLDDVGTRLKSPELQVALLRKLLSGEIRHHSGPTRPRASGSATNSKPCSTATTGSSSPRPTSSLNWSSSPRSSGSSATATSNSASPLKRGLLRRPGAAGRGMAR